MPSSHRTFSPRTWNKTFFSNRNMARWSKKGPRESSTVRTVDQNFWAMAPVPFCDTWPWVAATDSVSSILGENDGPAWCPVMPQTMEVYRFYSWENCRTNSLVDFPLTFDYRRFLCKHQIAVWSSRRLFFRGFFCDVSAGSAGCSPTKFQSCTAQIERTIVKSLRTLHVSRI